MASERPLLLVWILFWTSAPILATAADLFWYDANVANGRIRSCDLTSCSPSDFDTGVAPGLDGDIAIDPVEAMVYWRVNGAVGANSTIQRKSLFGGATEDIFSVNGYVMGIAIDPVARHVYVSTPNVAARIQRLSIDAPGDTPATVVVFNEAGCASCAAQGLALDLGSGLLYWADSANGKISRKSIALPSPIVDVVTGLSQPNALALDLVNDRVYFSQTTPSRITYALLSSPTTLADLLNPSPDGLQAGGLERDPAAGTLGEMYIALSSSGEIRHCSIDAGCASLALLDDGLIAPRGLALWSVKRLPLLGPLGVACLVFLLAIGAIGRGLRRSPWPSGRRG